MTNKKITDFLLKSKIISENQLTKAQEEAKQTNQPILDTLITLSMLKFNELGKAMSELYGVKYVILSKETIGKDIFNIIPYLVAHRQGVIVFNKNKEGLHVAMSNPDDLEMVSLLRKKTGDKIIIYYASRLEIIKALSQFYDISQEKFKKKIAKFVVDLAKQKSGETKGEEAPIVSIVDMVLEYAFINQASDIHVEPRENKVDIRYRIDGILHDVVDLPSHIHDLIVTRIKILAKLRTDERRSAQDGKLQFVSQNQKIDIRVSIIPITYGEKVVMRLLVKQGRNFTLEDLGFCKRDLKVLKDNIHKPWGMILATGPTGSGKTTTLYAILNILNTREVNISTIEDPVEYDIEGVNQIQVNPRANLTFAAGLRSILRQDPNIIMVGEIRDQETAQIAVNSALTGHLVLTTLHTNDAATTLPRLLDMSIEPFLIASTVNIAIGQRLVRKICTHCKTSHKIIVDELPVELLKSLSVVFKKKLGKNIEVFSGKGCGECHESGYKGRMGIYEVLEMDEVTRSLIMKRANADQIRTQARSTGMATIVEDGIRKVVDGLTTIEEVIRVTKE